MLRPQRNKFGLCYSGVGREGRGFGCRHVGGLARSEGPVYARLVYVRFVLDLGLVAVDAARIVHVPSLVHAAALGSFERVVHPNLWIVQAPTELLVEGLGIEEHLAQIIDVINIPSAEVLVEGLGGLEHRAHARDLTDASPAPAPRRDVDLTSSLDEARTPAFKGNGAPEGRTKNS